MTQVEITVKTISFAIPVYQNARALTLTYEAISQLFATKLTAYALEIVFVNDGSTDGSGDELSALRARDPRVKVVTFTRNFGQLAAIMCGLREAMGEAVITMSADLQDPIERVSDLVAEWERGVELAIVYRKTREDAWSSRITSWMFYRLVQVSIPQMPEGGFDFVLMDRKVVTAIAANKVRNRFFQGDILWLGFVTKFIAGERRPRTIGRSQYNFAKRLKVALDGILDASYMPVRFISALGVITALIGFLYAALIVYGRFAHRVPFTGWAPIMILILVLGGLTMFMIGIIGEYVWRIYDEVRGKPDYVVRERLR